MRHDFADIICQEGEVRNIRRMSGELPLRKLKAVSRGGFRCKLDAAMHNNGTKTAKILTKNELKCVQVIILDI